MGWFDTAEETEKKEKIKQLKQQLAGQPLADLFDEKDYTKVLIQQNHALHSLLMQLVLIQGGLASDVFAFAHNSMYYNNLDKLMDTTKINTDE